MPDRPKRRRNNKNKRKNKNNSQIQQNKAIVPTIGELHEVLSDVHSKSDNNVECTSVQSTSATFSEDKSTSDQNHCSTKNEECEFEQENDNTMTNTKLQEIKKEHLPEMKVIDNYIVESPKQSTTNIPKLGYTIKSKSLDNDDIPKIVDITDDIGVFSEEESNLPIIDSSNTVVSEAESDVEWETTDNLDKEYVAPNNKTAIGTLSIQTIPLDVAVCEHNQVLTPEEELSLRQCLQSLDLATHPANVTSIEVESHVETSIHNDVKHKLRKKAMTDDLVRPRISQPRFLDVIDEEGSSESSATSRRQSQLTERRYDYDDLDDEVFIDNNKQGIRPEKHPVAMSALSKNYRPFFKNIPQECFLVGAKIVEPEVTEAKGDWTMKTIEQIKGAEVVYLTDSSSSASVSDMYDINEESDGGNETDVSVRIITPTIEVTDTDSLLKSISHSDNIQKFTDFHDEFPSTDEDKMTITKNNGQPSENSIICENMNASHPHEILVLSTDNLQTNLYVLDTKEDTKNQDEKLTTHVALPRDINMETDTNKTIDFKTMTPEEPNLMEAQIHSEKLIETHADLTKAGLVQTNVNEIPNLDVPVSILNSDETNDLNGNGVYNMKIKVLKCELNDAFNNLLKEVSSDSEINEDHKETFSRQDSSSSVGSSQCTAKYNPNYSSLNDITNSIHDETVQNTKDKQDEFRRCLLETSVSSHVKDVFEHIMGKSTLHNNMQMTPKQPALLRDFCVKKIASFPYGEKILEELASVSERLQNINIISRKINTENVDLNFGDNKQDKITVRNEKTSYVNMPEVLTIDKVVLSTRNNNITPPPIKPRRSSLKKSQEDSQWTGLPTKTESGYVCLSPSQKMLMEKTNTTITKDDKIQSVNAHQKYIEKKDYDYQKGEQHNEQSQIDKSTVPFKSRTGNRLLAIIRDPVITNNIYKATNNNSYKSLDNLTVGNIQRESKHTKTQGYDIKNISLSRDFIPTAHFKPIPPPRPKHYSSTMYESDESSNFTDNYFRSIKCEKRMFHHSTGNLNKEIEKDVSTIQNMHRNYTTGRDNSRICEPPRRPSLPKEICDIQMEYIKRKELEFDNEVRRLDSQKHTSPEKRGPRAPLLKDFESVKDNISTYNHHINQKRNILYNNKLNIFQKLSDEKKISSFSSQEELMREKMYSEYVCQMAERQERKDQKIIKVTNNSPKNENKISKSLCSLHVNDAKSNNIIEEEFISRAKERWNKLGIKDSETEDERDLKDIYREPKVIEHKIKVIEAGQEKDVKNLPGHLQDFVRFSVKDKKQSTSSPAVWRPGAPSSQYLDSGSGGAVSAPAPPPPPPPVWSPGSAGASPHSPRRSFRPVHFEDTPPPTRKLLSTLSGLNGCGSESEKESRGLRTSLSAPASGLSALSGPTPPAPPTGTRLPRAQNPTVTLLQKARENQIPRGAAYLQESDSARLPRDRATPPKGDPVHALRREYASESEAERRDYERIGSRKMADTQRKLDDIGPTTKDGMPVTLRSEVRDPSRWYKKMYDTIHKTKFDDDCVTIRYKSRRGQPVQRVSSNKSQYAYFDPRSGYLSEPEGGLSRLGSSTWSDAYDSDVTTGPRRRTASVQEERHHDEITSSYLPSNKYSTLASGRASQEVYKNQPGRIENYVPGKSSVVDKEAKQWWDEVMDIFDGQLSSTTSLPQASPKEKKDVTSAILSKSNMARALKESGYESDSTLVFRRRDDTEAPLSPAERRAAYRDLQAGGEPPLRGFRSPAPPRQESPRRYVESDVNIHYRCPVRRDPLPLVPERELERQQADHMRRLYREQRRAKYLQDVSPSDIEAFDESIKELQDMQNRRHQDNFTPSQKAVVPLNRYDEAGRVIARALYAFSGQTPRELSFAKGEIITVRRQVDANWFEGEIHGRIGLFPYNYVEILKGEATQPQKRPASIEGRARAKFDFTAQTGLELPLKKGEIVVLTRRIDHNWWEGRHGNKTGIFPDSYVIVLQEPSQNKPEHQPILSSDKPVASPASHVLLNGSAKRSMGAHSYTPQLNSPALANAPPATQPLPGYVAKPAQATLNASERGYGPPTGHGTNLNNTEPLYIDTNAEAVPYRAMYKYRPQNPDELELREGDTVYVLEKCDDGWYVGSSQRTGRLGTFPGNYVERI